MVGACSTRRPERATVQLRDPMAIIAQPDMHHPVTRTGMPRSLSIWAIAIENIMLPPGEAISTGSRISATLRNMSVSTGPESDTAPALEARPRAHASALYSFAVMVGPSLGGRD